MVCTQASTKSIKTSITVIPALEEDAIAMDKTAVHTCREHNNCPLLTKIC